jgi:aryl sulfotransferase
VHYRTLICDSARWVGFTFRPDDIVISTSPKCGTTWMQMLCALLVFQDPHFDRPLTEISPWLDQQTASVDSVFALLDAQRHRRFIKTHTPFDGLPLDDRVTYICVGRDPRDVALSMDHHWDNMDLDAVLRVRAAAVGDDDVSEFLANSPVLARPDDARTRFLAWVDNDGPVTTTSSSLGAVVHHVETFWTERGRDNVALFHYSDLERDLVGEMTRLATLLDVSIGESRVAELAEAARFDAMKQRAPELAPNSDVGIFRDLGSFFHAGRSGQWRDLLGPGDLDHYDARLRELAGPDLAAWLQAGRRVP